MAKMSEKFKRHMVYKFVPANMYIHTYEYSCIAIYKRIWLFLNIYDFDYITLSCTIWLTIMHNS